MTTSAPVPPTPRAARPLSPHLQIYKPQLTTAMSIVHRITGIGLSLALPAIVAWLLALSQGPEVYQAAMQCFTSPVGKLFLLGWAWAFNYHLCAGIRHLFWDAGHGLELRQAYMSGRIALVVSTLLTLFMWAHILGLFS